MSDSSESLAWERSLNRGTKQGSDLGREVICIFREVHMNCQSHNS